MLNISKNSLDLGISKNEESGSKIALYTDDGYGYEVSNSSSFPTEGYTLNTEKSSCTNGELSQNEDKSINLSITSNSK